MTRPWITTGLAATALVTLAILGCGGQPDVNPATRYTPEALGEELAFRYKALDPARRNQTKPRPAPSAKASLKTAQAETKAAQATTLDDLVRETLGKANLIAGTPHPEVVAGIVAAITKDASLADADRKVITERLRAEDGAKSGAID